MKEDMRELQQQQRNLLRGNLLRHFHVNPLHLLRGRTQCSYVFYASGERLNRVHCAGLTRHENQWHIREESTLAFDSQITNISEMAPISRFSSQFERLVVASTTTQDVHLIRAQGVLIEPLEPEASKGNDLLGWHSKYHHHLRLHHPFLCSL